MLIVFLACGFSCFATPDILAAAQNAGPVAKYAPPSSEPENLIVINGTLYFSANDGLHGTELWRLRSLASAPELISDITPGPGGTTLSNFSSVQGKLLFRVE